MKSRIVSVAAFAALVALPLALNAQDKPAQKGPFAVADADGNGELSRAEFGTIHKGKKTDADVDALFAKLDSDGNKSLTRAEFRAGAPKPGEGAKKKPADGEKKKPKGT